MPAGDCTFEYVHPFALIVHVVLGGGNTMPIVGGMQELRER